MTSPSTPIPAAGVRSPVQLSRQLEPELMDSEDDARDYDEMDHRDVNARFVEDLLALRPDLSRTLDVGTGTALIPIEVCRRASDARIVAIDLADHMLALGGHNVERAALSGVIELAKSDAKRLGYADATFTCVISNSIVHHVPLPQQALAEMERVLAPGGLLFVRDLARPSDDRDVTRLVERHAAAASPRQQALFEASLRASLTPDETRLLFLPRGGTVAMTSDRHWTLVWKKP
jgi:ubiquinone/menaquinone biosynthesis C-methylase UbiE